MSSVSYEEMLEKEGQVITHVAGFSMVPLLYDRQSIVIVEDIRNREPQHHDVVLYKIGDTYILHRILKILEEDYLIRGDNTWVIEHVPKNCVMAVMTGFYRRPEGKLIDRKNVLYQLYVFLLPLIRWGRRIGRKIRNSGRGQCRNNGSETKSIM